MVADIIGAGDRWIPEEEYKLIEASVPILCVDVLLLSTSTPPMIGLIQRDTYNGGRGWCLVGGAVLRDEPLAAAVERHVQATLGSEIFLQPSTLQLPRLSNTSRTLNSASFTIHANMSLP